jgi:ATP-binding protein involved in chromosome partitioning
MSAFQPRTITKSDPSKLSIEWIDGHRTVYSAARLRSLCPCAMCVSEDTGQRVHDPRSVPADLTQTDVRLVGNYAVSIQFADGHNTGIYSFRFLRDNDSGS